MNLKDKKRINEVFDKFYNMIIFLFMMVILIIVVLAVLFTVAFVKIQGLQETINPEIKTEPWTEIYEYKLGDNLKVDLKDDIICEDGLIVNEYKHSGYYVIFGCLELDENGNCAGEGKSCIIRHN